jgi:uncharacterized protein YbjQ (UPF0145 family)
MTPALPALSDLSVTEFLTLSRIGFLPLGIVIGSSVYDAGFQNRFATGTAEVVQLSEAMRAARALAISRMLMQSAAFGAEGIVGVRLTVEHHQWRGGNQVAKFIAMGTAVSFDHAHGPVEFRSAPSLRLTNGSPFASDLSGKDFVGLLRAGYRPITVATGTCVYQLDPRETARYVGHNAEIGAFTRAFFDARETAMGRLQHDLFSQWPPGHPDVPTGIVGMTVRESAYGQRGFFFQGPPLVEFTAIGTAIAPLRAGDPRRAAERPKPTVVVALDR